MNDVQIFNNPNFGEVRTINENGTILFCAKDVAKALGYTRPRNAVSSHCPHALKRGVGVQTGLKSDGTPAIQNIDMLFIPESDLYRLIFDSKLEKAEEFTDWVTSEVLPSIRKHGAYATAVTIENMINNPEFAIQLLTTLKNEKDMRQALELENAHQKQLLLEAQPKLEYVDNVLSATNGITITQIAKEYGISAIKLNKILHERKIQYKHNGEWVLYAKHADKGYVISNTYDYIDEHGEQCAKIHNRWTQLGRQFIHEDLKKIGMVPRKELEANV